MNDDLLAVAAAPPPWLGERDPRSRLLVALATALVAVNLQGLPALLALLGTLLGLALAAGLPATVLIRRLLLLEGFMVVLLLFLPFSVAGAVWWEVGPLAMSREGARLAAAIFLRANAVVVTLLVLVGTLDAVTLGHALSRLRLPDKLVHLLLFTVRYLGLLHEEYRRLRQAMRSRGFVARSDRHTWRSLGWLMGMLLVRSLERSRRILDAMRCRGFRGRLYLLDGPPWQPGDSLFAGVCGLILACFLIFDLGGQ